MFTTARGAAAVRFMKTAMQSAKLDLLICLLRKELFTLSRATTDPQGGSHFCFLHSAQHHSGTIVILDRFFSINATEGNSHNKQTNIKTNKCKNATNKQTNKQRT